MVQKRGDDAGHSIIWHIYPGHSVMDHYFAAGHIQIILKHAKIYLKIYFSNIIVGCHS